MSREERSLQHLLTTPKQDSHSRSSVCYAGVPSCDILHDRVLTRIIFKAVCGSQIATSDTFGALTPRFFRSPVHEPILSGNANRPESKERRTRVRNFTKFPVASSGKRSSSLSSNERCIDARAMLRTWNPSRDSLRNREHFFGGEQSLSLLGVKSV